MTRFRKSTGIVAALFTALALLACACAETLSLPAGLVEIRAEAFAGNTTVTDVVVPEGVEAIGENAFSGCANLGWITLPGSAVSLGAGFLDGCAEDLLIRTPCGSAAWSYAVENLVDYQADTAYRALLIGQTYPDLPDLTLEGPERDVRELERVLGTFSDTDYAVSIAENVTADGLLGAIADTLGGAGEQDVSLFYYSGHGICSSDSSRNGALLGMDGMSVVTASQLRTALDGVAGRKIVIIDACYSGNLIDDGDEDATLSVRSAVRRSPTEGVFTHEDFVDSFISAFSGGARRSPGGLSGGGYFVLTAAAADEESYEGVVGDSCMGLFTSALIRGCGLDCASGSWITPQADDNGNGVLTLFETYYYTRTEVLRYGQHVQVYPSGCGWFGVFRK